MASPATLVFVTALLALLLPSPPPALALPFDVGDESGWLVPNDHKDNIYNDWASTNRFTTGDTLRFKYRKKDSVMVVGTEKEYKECNSSHPVFFSNKGDTVYELAAPGTYYFISGVLGHCQNGQRMIVKAIPPFSEETSPGVTDRDFSGSSTATTTAISAAVAPVAAVAFLF